MPTYVFQCRECRASTDVFSHKYLSGDEQDALGTRCENCAAPTRREVCYNVFARSDWKPYFDHGLGVQVNNMSDIDRRLQHLRRPQSFVSDQDGQVHEVPGQQLEYAGGTHRGSKDLVDVDAFDRATVAQNAQAAAGRARNARIDAATKRPAARRLSELSAQHIVKGT